jgi:hypothetical protein
LRAITIRSVRLRRRVKPVVASRRHEELDKRPACVRRHLIGVLTCCHGAGGNAEGTQHGASARKQRELRDAGHEGVVVVMKNGEKTSTDSHERASRPAHDKDASPVETTIQSFQCRKHHRPTTGPLAACPRRLFH